MQSDPIQTTTIVSSGANTARRFVKWDGTQAAAAGNAAGVTRSDAADGEAMPVDTLGTTVVEAGGAIAVDARIEVGATGKAVTLAAGKAVAVAVEAAAADGDMIEVFLIPN